MAQKYSKRHDIQHFEIGDIVSLKVFREDRTSTNNQRLFRRILNKLYPYRYKVVTLSRNLKRLILTKELGIVQKALWLDINIPESIKEVILGLAAKEASTSTRVRISCQCKGLCNTKRYKCYKEAKHCSTHCYQDENEYKNLSSLATRTKVALVDKPRRKQARADTTRNKVQVNSIYFCYSQVV